MLSLKENCENLFKFEVKSCGVWEICGKSFGKLNEIWENLEKI